VKDGRKVCKGRHLVADFDGEAGVHPVTVDPQNGGRSRKRKEAKNQNKNFQKKTHFFPKIVFSKNFFFRKSLIGIVHFDHCF
jgi:hypothetical protein